MPKYRRRKGHDTWHWYSTCSNWPTNDYYEGMDVAGRPTVGELCNECLAKERAGRDSPIEASASGRVDGNSIDEIPSEIIAKYKSIDLMKNEAIKKYLIYYLIFSVVSIIFYFIFPKEIILPFIIGTLLVMISIFETLETQDKLFVKLYKSIEMLKLSETNPDFLNNAYKNFNDAMGYLTIYSEYSFPWNSNNDEINVKFASNLKSLVSPAILDGLIDYKYLSKIALAFVNSDINDINILNAEIDEKLGNILFKLDEPDKSIKNIFLSYINSIYSSTITKFILSISIGYLTTELLILIFTSPTNYEITLGEKIVSVGAFSYLAAIAVSLTKEKIFRIREDNGWPLKWTKKR